MMVWGASIAEISTVKINVFFINFNEVISYYKCDKIIVINIKCVKIHHWRYTFNNCLTLIFPYKKNVHHLIYIIIINLLEIPIQYKKRNDVLLAYKWVLVSMILLKSLTLILYHVCFRYEFNIGEFCIQKFKI